MTEILLVLLAQGFITEADVYARAHAHQFKAALLKHWITRYAITRSTGLVTRLGALYALPVGAAATLFSISAVSVSTFVATRGGERLTAREAAAIRLIVAAIILRSLP